MKIKIISKKEYDELIKLLKEAYVIVKSLDADNKKLQKENTELKRVVDKSMISCIYGTSHSVIDFPNSSKELKSSGDTNY